MDQICVEYYSINAKIVILKSVIMCAIAKDLSSASRAEKSSNKTAIKCPRKPKVS